MFKLSSCFTSIYVPININRLRYILNTPQKTVLHCIVKDDILYPAVLLQREFIR